MCRPQRLSDFDTAVITFEQASKSRAMLLKFKWFSFDLFVIIEQRFVRKLPPFSFAGLKLRLSERSSPNDSFKVPVIFSN